MAGDDSSFAVTQEYSPEQYDIFWNSFLPMFFDRMNATMRNHMTNAVSNYGITSAHAIYLIALTLRDGQTQLQLSNFLDMDPANTNRVVKVLRNKGLVYDDRKNPGSRNFAIRLTEEGRKIGKHVMASTTKWMNECMDGVTREEILSMRSVLLRILNKMDPDLDRYMMSEFTNPFFTYIHTNPESKEGLFRSIVAKDGETDNGEGESE